MKKIAVIISLLVSTYLSASNSTYTYCIDGVTHGVYSKPYSIETFDFTNEDVSYKYMAVTTQYTLVAAGGNYSVAATWSPAVVPTSADNILCNASSGQLTIVATASITGADFTAYTGTVTLNKTFTNSGNVTLGSGMTWTTTAGSPILSVNATSTLNSNTKAFPYTLDLRGTSQTFTLADDWSILNFTNNSVTNATVNGHNIFCVANTTNNVIIKGTTLYTITGTGTWRSNDMFGLSLTFAAGTGTITIYTGQMQYLGSSGGTSTVTYISGTMVTAGASITLAYAGVTFNTSTMTWANTFTFPAGFILASDLHISGTIANLSGTVNGLFYIYASGNINGAGT